MNLQITSFFRKMPSNKSKLDKWFWEDLDGKTIFVHENLSGVHLTCFYNGKDYHASCNDNPSIHFGYVNSEFRIDGPEILSQMFFSWEEAVLNGSIPLPTKLKLNLQLKFNRERDRKNPIEKFVRKTCLHKYDETTAKRKSDYITRPAKRRKKSSIKQEQ